MQTKQLSIGIEEELFLVEQDSLDLIQEPPDQLIQQFCERFPEQLVGEYLPCQVEIISTPCENIQDIASQMKSLRSHLIELAQQQGLYVIAASTFPSADWRSQTPRDNKRYERLSEKLKTIAGRLLTCGMHVHIGIDDPDQRLKVNNLIGWYLPYFLVLSTSSPFWRGTDTGINGYRLSIMDSLPRVGIPPQFDHYQQYQQYIDALVNSKAINDASEVWWDSRLSAKFPTVEMRIMDTCTSINDTIAVASFAYVLIHHLLSQLDEDHGLQYHLLSRENRWNAQRYPIPDCQLIADDKGNVVDFQTIIQSTLQTLQPQAQKLNCVTELFGVERILEQGTSADRQRRTYQAAIASGMENDLALKEVIKELVQLTRCDAT